MLTKLPKRNQTWQRSSRSDQSFITCHKSVDDGDDGDDENDDDSEDDGDDDDYDDYDVDNDDL